MDIFSGFSSTSSYFILVSIKIRENIGLPLCENISKLRNDYYLRHLYHAVFNKLFCYKEILPEFNKSTSRKKYDTKIVFVLHVLPRQQSHVLFNWCVDPHEWPEPPLPAI